MPAPQFYPALNKLISSENVPEPIKSGIDSLFSKLFYKSYYVEKSVYGDTAYHHLVLVFNKIGFNLFGGDDGFEIIFNPGSAANTTEIPVSLYYNLPILKYVRKIKLEDLNSVEDYFNLILEMFNISKDDILFEAIRAFLGEEDDSIEAFIEQFNNNPNYSTYTPLALPNQSGDFDNKYTLVQSLLQQFDDNNLDVKIYLLENYISTIDIEAGIENLSKLFKRWMREFSFKTIFNLFIPKFSVSVDVLEVALAFPRKWLIPVNATTLEVIEDENVKAMLICNVGSVAYNSETGFEFVNPDNFDLTLCQIGNTGIIIKIENLAFDFKNDRNIPQADADGRPLTFKGIYAEEINIILPKKWFKDVDGTTAKISGYNILIGTEGGVSGTVALVGLGGDNTLWVKVGSSNGFKLGFKEFDITFKQNKVTSSNIKGALEIKKFVYPGTTTPVRINVEGHLSDNGDFNLTASASPPYPIEFPGLFIYSLKSVELGKEGSDFYIGTSGQLQFKDVPILGNLQAIDINRLRIYSDGSIEIQGGSIALVKPFVLPLGPVAITVAAIHYGSHQKEVAGVMRKFNYFGFDGGISIDPLGLEVRGDGVKLYYCVDDLPDKPNPYLHIQKLYVDLTIPVSTPTVIINGWLTIPEPGVSPEYVGKINIKLPNANITGVADMKLAPKYPAFIIDAELELPKPIPLGSFAVYGFRGLIGYRYVAEKEAIGLVSGVNTWYDYYKAPTKGINVRKFRRPAQTSKHQNPVSIGAGAILGTSHDDGYTMSIKAMVLLSIPSLFMIDGRANVLNKRLGLDDGGDPPFFAFVALGDNSLELGFGADYKLPKHSGHIFSLYAEVQAGFFFDDSSKWYINFGTKTNPVTARVLTLITLKSFLMLSAKGIEAGARGEFVFNRTYGPVRISAWAYVEVGGKISFQRPQMGAYLAAGVGADINIRILRLHVSLDILFGVEASQPFLIYGKFRLCVKVKILFIKIKFCGNIEIAWEFNKTVNRDPINPLIANSDASRLNEVVKGVHMLTNETFDLAYLGGTIPAGLDPRILDTIIPLDTYIDITSEKGLLPGAVSHLIGGVNNPPTQYTDLIPPDEVVRGKPLRPQVKHQYVVDSIAIKAWNGTAWVDYHPYKAMYPNETSGVFNSLKIGQWQKADGQYNAIRLLATTPFSYTEQGEPGWFITEKYGVTASSLFCEGQEIEKHCATFLNKPLGHRYYCYDTNNHFFYSNNVSFMLLNSQDDEYAGVVSTSNVFNINQSLAFKNSNTLQIILPKSSYEVDLRVSNFYQGVKVKYYSTIKQDNAYEVPYGHPNTGLTPSQRRFPYEVLVPMENLNVPIRFSLAGRTGWDAIAKIEIEPYFSEATNALTASIRNQIEAIETANMQILLGVIQGNYQSTASLEAQLDDLLHKGSMVVKEHYRFDLKNNVHTLIIEGRDVDYTSTWDLVNDRKFQQNIFGFKRANRIIIESDFKIMHVKLLQIIQGNMEKRESSIVPAGNYKVEYDNKRAYVNLSNQYNQYFDSGVFDFEIDYYKEGACCKTQKSFINRYVAGIHGYKDSIQIEDFIYAVGFLTDTNSKLGLITKTNLDGDVIWQKTYRGTSDSLVFESVIKCKNEDLMVVAQSTDNYRFTLYRINSDGNIIWKKRYTDPAKDTYTVTVKVLKLLGETYVLAMHILGVEDEKQFVKIDKRGRVLISKRLNDPKELISIADSILYRNKIVVIGNQLSGVHHTNVGSVVILDENFKLIHKFGLRLDSGHSIPQQLILSDAAIQNNQLLLSGAFSIVIPSGIVDDDGEAESPANPFIAFITKIDISDNHPKTGKQKLTMVNYDYQMPASHYRIKCNSNSIYFNYFGNHYARLDSNLKVVWVKTFPLTIDRITEERILLHGPVLLPGSTSSQKIWNGVLGSANLELDSCKTDSVNKFEVYTTNGAFTSDFSFSLNPSDITENDIEFLEKFEIRNEAHIKEEICKIAHEASRICSLYNSIKIIYQAHFNTINLTGYLNYVNPVSQIADLLKVETELFNNPEFPAWYGALDRFKNSPSSASLIQADLTIKNILDYLNQLGNCTCKCDDHEHSDKTILHEVCWLTREDYEYNINIPGQGAISEDAFATVAGINQFIQPIWRPDTSYLVHFQLRDIVDNSATPPYPFTYGFSTAGPVGFFHTHLKANYGDLKHPDKYPLTSLRQYIDYQRSYPNADGNLLSAKPLFYDDSTNTKISLYFSKVYASHFFKEWDANPALGLGARKGRMKIVIKDPREDISIINPPSLNGVVTTDNIPQTQEEWTQDDAPLVPFVWSQWINMFMANENCIFTDKPKIIKPASKYLSVKLHKLKPQKLYTALVNNIYDVDKDGALGPVPDANNPAVLNQANETREVHKFVFQTSRYKNFKAQVESYILFEGEGNARVERKAFFKIEKAITDVELNVLWKTIKGESISNMLPQTETNALLANYLHAFDRAVEGILKISPVNAAISTEINFIRNTASGNVVALLVRNPEPFNNPKMPVESVLDTIVVRINGSADDTSYKVLHSKDYSQVLIMPENKIVHPTFGLQFKYKIWDGAQYVVNANNPNDTVTIATITLNLQN